MDLSMNNSQQDNELLKSTSCFVKSKFPSSVSILPNNNTNPGSEYNRPILPFKTGKKIIKKQTYNPTFLAENPDKENVASDNSFRKENQNEIKPGYNLITNQDYESYHPLSTKYSKDKFSSCSSFSPPKSIKNNESPMKNPTINQSKDTINYNSIQKFDDHSRPDQNEYLVMFYKNGILQEVSEEQDLVKKV